MTAPRARTIRLCLAGIALIALAAAAFAWLRRPAMPPIRDVDSAMTFMGSDEFNRYSESQRLKYAMDTVEKMRDLPFDELVRQLTRYDEQRTRMLNNLRKIGGHERVGSGIFALFLDRFWEQNPGKRTATLMSLALIQQGQFGKHPDRYGLPSGDQIKTEMNKFVTRQPVKTQAQFAQFMVELKRQREFMGLKDPF